MTPLQIVRRARLAHEANVMYTKMSLTESDADLDMGDIEYFKGHFFKHSSVKNWSDPNHKLSLDDTEALKIALSLGW